MRASVTAPPKRAKRKKGELAPVEAPPQPAQEVIVVELYSSESPDASCVLPPSTPNSEAWRLARLLRVDDTLFHVELNPPTVEQMSLPKVAIQGLPLLPAVQLLFAEEEVTQWRWLRQHAGSQAWVEVGCSSSRYTPSECDLGCQLRCECTPAARRVFGSGEATASGRGAAGGGQELWLGEASHVQTGIVEPIGVATAADIRHPAPPCPTQSPSFRVLSYNILADQYAGSDYAKKVLFNYCPLRYLESEYRKQLVLQELERYCADVVCLQEVDEKVFLEFLLPHLRCLGYEGRFTNKMGKVKEGSATFHRTSRFQAVASHDILLRDAFREPLPPLHSQFAPLLEASPTLTDALQKVTTIAQATLLRPLSSDSTEAPICVVNTHLFFHPYAPHIRTMHSAAILEEARSFLDAAMADPSLHLGPTPPTLLFCGDLNSDLNDGVPGVVELLRSGKLPADFWDWENGAAFAWGKGEELEEAAASGAAPPTQGAAGPPPNAQSPSESMHGQGADFVSTMDEPSSSLAVTGIDLEVPFKLQPADDLKTPYTNYTSGYKALLDYVWYEPSCLEVTRQMPVPAEELLSSFIPSRAFPSDHLAVVYDFRWRGAAAGKSP